MKKPLSLMLFVCLVACTNIPKQNDSETKEQYITNKRSGYLLDLCNQENMPEYPKRPKLTSKEILHLSESQMDVRIQAHLSALERHVDLLEAVIEKTRQRVDRCR